MSGRRRGPGASCADAHRAEVIRLAGKIDFTEATTAHRELQVRRIVERFAVSRPVAIVIAELAFLHGRRG